VVYIDGAFDLFHIGHVEALKHAKSLGTYLIVGIHEDAVSSGVAGLYCVREGFMCADLLSSS